MTLFPGNTLAERTHFLFVLIAVVEMLMITYFVLQALWCVWSIGLPRAPLQNVASGGRSKEHRRRIVFVY